MVTEKINGSKISASWVIPLIITLSGMILTFGITWGSSQAKIDYQNERISIMQTDIDKLKAYNIELMNYRIGEIDQKVNALLEYFKIPAPRSKK